MNILEALQAIDDGKIVKLETEDEVYFAFQTILLPFEVKEFCYISISRHGSEFDKPIQSIKDLYEIKIEGPKFCLFVVKSNKFEIVSEQQMIDVINHVWHEFYEKEEKLKKK